MSFYEDFAKIKAKEAVRAGVKSQRVQRQLDPASGEREAKPGGSKGYLMLIAFLIAGLALGGIIVTQVIF